MINKINGYFEKINENKHLMLVPTNDSKDRIKRYDKLWIETRDLIRSVTEKSDEMIMKKNCI